MNTYPLLTRFWLEYRQVWQALLARDLLDRLVFLAAFGFGMGAIVKHMGEFSYLSYVATGIVCSSPMMTMTMAGTYGAFERFNSSRVWQSWLATPLTLRDILLAEIVYANVRAMPSVFILLGLVWALGELPNPWGILPAVPLLMLTNMVYGSVALCFTATTTRILYFAYVNTLWMMPMYLFSGVFYDLAQAPWWLQALANIYPLTHVLNVVRPLLLGQPVELTTMLLDVAILLAAFVVTFAYAVWKFKQRLLA
ncbi:MAG: ABC transporter permease [Alphaproteobacteria bacterium]